MKEYIVVDGHLMRRKEKYGDLLAGGALVVAIVVGLFALVINSIPAK